MNKDNCFTLNYGVQMPKIGFGTWQSKPNEVKEAVKVAIDAGYRYIDCAYLYLNETEVGEALQEKIADGTVTRKEMFICSKLWSTFHEARDVIPSLKESLAMLQLDYVDLYLIHWPIAFKRGEDPFPRDANGAPIYVDVDYIDTWKALEKAVDAGLIKAIGLSNFNSKQVQRVIDNCRIKPANLQVEIHPYLSQEKLVQFCRARDIVVTAYSPFGSPARPWDDPKPQPILENEQIIAIGKKHGKSPAQVILRWFLQRQVVPIPKSVTAARIRENIDIFNFVLTQQETQAIDAINQNLRLVLYGKGASDVKTSAPHFPFNEEF